MPQTLFINIPERQVYWLIIQVEIKFKHIICKIILFTKLNLTLYT